MFFLLLLIKYPQWQKYPTAVGRFFLKRMALLVLLLFIFGVSSCRTCKCPAYSYYETSVEDGRGDTGKLNLRS